jgi:hypothetical protein
MVRSRADRLRHARFFIGRVCRLAGQVTCIDDMRHDAGDCGLTDAVDHHDMAVIFNWLMRAVSHQGISDAVVDGYIGRNGNAT